MLVIGDQESEILTAAREGAFITFYNGSQVVVRHERSP